jgi:ankyrin repeat protein
VPVQWPPEFTNPPKDFSSAQGNLWDAIQTHDFDWASRSIKDGAVVSKAHWDLGVCFASPEILDLLMASGADVLAIADTGNTSLHLAAAFCPYGPMLYPMLVAVGVDPNALNKDGEAALHLVAGKNDPQSCVELLRLGADPSLLCNGKTAIGVAETADAKEAADQMRAYEQSRKALASIERVLERSRVTPT